MLFRGLEFLHCLRNNLGADYMKNSISGRDSTLGWSLKSYCNYMVASTWVKLYLLGRVRIALLNMMCYLNEVVNRGATNSFWKASTRNDVNRNQTIVFTRSNFVITKAPSRVTIPTWVAVAKLESQPWLESDPRVEISSCINHNF